MGRGPYGIDQLNQSPGIIRAEIKDETTVDYPMNASAVIASVATGESGAILLPNASEVPEAFATVIYDPNALGTVVVADFNIIFVTLTSSGDRVTLRSNGYCWDLIVDTTGS